MNRSKTIFIVFVLVGIVIILWQVVEHNRFKESARKGLLNRAVDISDTVAIVLQSQRRPDGFISQSRLETALQKLAESEELHSITLLNSAGEVVLSASAGDTEIDINNLPQQVEQWGKKSVAYMNLVDFGANVLDENQEESPTIIIDDNRFRPDSRRGRPRFPSPEGSPEEPPEGPPGEFQEDRRNNHRNGPPEWGANEIPSATAMIPDVTRMASEFISRMERFRQRGGRPGFGFGRPPWISEERYQALIQKQGLHGFVIELSTQQFLQDCQRDQWLRITICGFAFAAIIGLGFAWRNLVQSSSLQLRLIRASEMNTHLREMNIAAAGLAHETRNPLNIVRGLAQIIAKQADTSEEIRNRSLKITDEVDRITVQLNEFIEYSKPRELKPSAVLLNSLINDVHRALKSDIEDKMIYFQLQGPELTVEADELLFRQVIFNLFLNAIQSVEEKGCIEIILDKNKSNEVTFEIRDDGPGIAPENQDKIFRPYFTTREKGTGLGLAVVHQIVLAHGWEIAYVPGENQGARFRIRGLRLASKEL
ncbi:MAG: hypothetical protein C4527_15170 [Candidatus Omnitrophota bacterium]|jgi:signal transduction histidine kinase|nr:MAG: hypothetical protein C4527_15170 [Candidatus Omnitrophota bacterium]